MKTSRVFKSTVVRAAVGDVTPPDAELSWRLVSVVAHPVVPGLLPHGLEPSSGVVLLAFWEADPHISISLGG